MLGLLAGTGALFPLDGSSAEDGQFGIDARFQPPAKYAHALGAYRSPLQFDSGRAVNTDEEWLKRRREILEYWHGVMGPWPPLLENPVIKQLEVTKREGFSQQRVRVDVAAGQTVEGWLLIPNGNGPFPAVLVPYYDPETSIGLTEAKFRSFGLDLARRGFVTLSIGSPGGDARNPDPGRPGWQPLSYLAYVAANCHTALAQLPSVDSERIGVVGHSYGGKWAMFASCLHEEFACAAWSDPGIVFDESRANVNYWEPWYLGRDPSLEQQRDAGIPTAENPATGAYKVLRTEGHDLHELHALMAPRPFLVSGGAEDPPSRWQALNHTVAVNALLGSRHRVAMSNRPKHSPNPESNEQIYLFFERFLKNQSE